MNNFISLPSCRAMGEACLSKHVEEQAAALALLITRINLNPDYSDCDTGKKYCQQFNTFGSFQFYLY